MDFKKLVSKGEEAVKKGNTITALSFFERAIALDDTPLCRSFFAYCIAKERGQFKKALALCEEAIKEDQTNPVHYLNMGRIYLLMNKRDDAMRVLREGLGYGEDKRLLDELSKMGIRKPPVFRSLDRSNPINKFAGLVLSKLGIR